MKNKKIGTFYGLSSALLYGLMPVISAIVYHDAGGDSKGVMFGILSAFCYVVLKEVFVFLFGISSGNPWKQLKAMGSIIKNDKKTTALTVASGLFGGIIGYSLLTAGAFLSGPGYSNTYMGLIPICVALYSKFVLKRSLNWKVWLGVGAIVLAVSGLSISSMGSLGNIGIGKMIAGSICSFLACITWAVEAVLMDIASERYKGKIVDLINIKVLSAIVFGFVLFVPVLGAISGHAFAGYELVGSYLSTQWKTGVGIILIAFVLYIGRVAIFSGIKYTGANYTMAIYQSNVIFSTALSFLALSLGFHFPEPTINVWFWLFSALIVLASAVIIKYSDTSFKEKVYEDKSLYAQKNILTSLLKKNSATSEKEVLMNKENIVDNETINETIE